MFIPYEISLLMHPPTETRFGHQVEILCARKRRDGLAFIPYQRGSNPKCFVVYRDLISNELFRSFFFSFDADCLYINIIVFLQIYKTKMNRNDIILGIYYVGLNIDFFFSEYGYMMKITEKSDVYSFGVVILEVLTGKQPIDPTIPDGLHVVDWVRQKRRGGIEFLDPTLLSRPESEVDEMLQALGIALLCVNSSPDERPTMKDVAAMLKEIRQEREEYAKVDILLKGSPVASRRENNNSGGVPETSSSTPAGVAANLYPKSNNTSFSASSLLYSSSSIAKMSYNS